MGLLFHPHTSLWGRALPVTAFTPRSWWGRRKVKERPKRSPLTQSLTLIINYDCFCFILPRAVTGSQGQKERPKGNFHQTELPIKTCEMNVQRASWMQCGEMKIYVFNRKHGMNKGLEKERKRRSVVVRPGGTCVPVFTSCPDPSLPTWHSWDRSSQ